MPYGVLEGRTTRVMEWKLPGFSAIERGTVVSEIFPYADESWTLKFVRSKNPKRDSMEQAGNAELPPDIYQLALVKAASNSACRVKGTMGYRLPGDGTEFCGKDWKHEFNDANPRKFGFFPSARLTDYIRLHPLPDDMLIVTCHLTVLQGQDPQPLGAQGPEPQNLGAQGPEPQNLGAQGPEPQNIGLEQPLENVNLHDDLHNDDANQG